MRLENSIFQICFEFFIIFFEYFLNVFLHISVVFCIFFFPFPFLNIVVLGQVCIELF